MSEIDRLSLSVRDQLAPVRTATICPVWFKKIRKVLRLRAAKNSTEQMGLCHFENYRLGRITLAADPLAAASGSGKAAAGHQMQPFLVATRSSVGPSGAGGSADEPAKVRQELL